MTARDLSLGFRVSDEFISRVDDPFATEVAINLLATAELAESRMESLLAPFGLSKGGFNLLMVLDGAEGPLTPSQLTERVVVRAATVTGLVDTLVRKGLVDRRPDTEDRRRVLVSITDQGREVVAAAAAEQFKNDALVYGIFSDADKEKLTRLMGRLAQHLRELDDRLK